MPARKVNGKWYVDLWIDVPGQGRQRLRKKSPVQTKKGAEQYERELAESALSSIEEEVQAKPEVTFEALAPEFLERHIRVQCKFSTFVTYESALVQHLIPTFGKQRLDEISGRDVAVFQSDLVNRGLSPKTVRNMVTVLSSALHTAKEWGYLDEVPLIRFPRVAPTRFRFLTPEECVKLEDVATKYWKPMIHFARKTGLRIGEITACDWEQINLGNGTVHVDRAVWRGKVSSPKGGRSRLVDLSPSTVHLLREMWKQQREPAHGLVFESKQGGIRQETKCHQGIKRAAKNAGLEPFGWHVLRHTFASQLVMAGVPIPVVQKLLGHTDIRLTMRYAHLSPGQTANAVEQLDLAGDRDRLGHYLGIGASGEGSQNRKSVAKTRR